jgi:N-acetylglucosamine-6-phosphate deacetylase
MTDILIRGGRVITDEGIWDGGTVHLRGGKIVQVSRGALQVAGAQVIDAAGKYVSPGFIDIHVHGALEATFSDATMEAFEKITRFYARYGVTALQCTPSALPLEEMRAVIAAFRQWKREGRHGGSEMLGIHFEGPYFNQAQRGAQPPQYIRNPGPEDFKLMLENTDVITEVTLAPEIPGAIELTKELVARGVLVSAGHSNGRDYELNPAIEAGVSHVTHIYSGCSMVIREGPYRVPGLVEVGLTHPKLTVEMIADGKHLPPTLMKLIVRARGLDRLCIVSDAIRAAGGPEGVRFMSDSAEVVIQDGVAMAADMSCFHGSITPLGWMVYNLIKLVELPLLDAVRLATRNPAKILHVDDRKGRLAAGMDADVAIFDEQINVAMTIVGGEIVYKA